MEIVESQVSDCEDICFDYISEKERASFYDLNLRYSMIIFIYSGGLRIDHKGRRTLLKKGEYVFIKQEAAADICIQRGSKEDFCGVYIGLSKPFLNAFYYDYCKTKISYCTPRFEKEVIKLDYTPYIQSIYISIIPYLRYNRKPSDSLIRIKQLESIYSLLLYDERFYYCLFEL